AARSAGVGSPNTSCPHACRPAIVNAASAMAQARASGRGGNRAFGVVRDIRGRAQGTPEPCDGGQKNGHFNGAGVFRGGYASRPAACAGAGAGRAVSVCSGGPGGSPVSSGR